MTTDNDRNNPPRFARFYTLSGIEPLELFRQDMLLESRLAREYGDEQQASRAGELADRLMQLINELSRIALRYEK